ncbi:M23 family metallopeptidase [Effusibacillus lacus]|uniref:M23ase beta-sheet core domain-containing protein n=1 Tax=Effusibacillus lacus TaxID=1348429 RepID=A0A292YM99_9BACL|nr:M23 family metallopeptidase [Effusibacillus lacus]TCS71797.1 stage II sporulation protein Q [Effusibacillus lacus]GAX89635.1 hypothetical protein EFBL_1259 [Effusibacillus lacus]
MNEEKNQNQNLAPRSQKKPGFLKSLFAKRWTFPALYLGAAALIIGIAVAQIQDAQPSKEAENPPVGTSVTDPENPIGEMPVTAGQELIWPVKADEKEAKVTMAFYDEAKDPKAKESSILKFENNFYTQNGVVMGRKDDKPFEVVAAASGTVSRVDSDALMGKVVEIKHDNGYVTYYASLSDIEVKEGDKVIQGQTIAKSGNNLLEKDQLNHLHFEVKKDGKNLDPVTVLPERK